MQVSFFVFFIAIYTQAIDFPSADAVSDVGYGGDKKSPIVWAKQKFDVSKQRINIFFITYNLFAVIFFYNKRIQKPVLERACFL